LLTLPPSFGIGAKKVFGGSGGQPAHQGKKKKKQLGKLQGEESE